jgi:hypothetical protein
MNSESDRQDISFISASNYKGWYVYHDSRVILRSSIKTALTKAAYFLWSSTIQNNTISHLCCSHLRSFHGNHVDFTNDRYLKSTKLEQLPKGIKVTPTLVQMLPNGEADSYTNMTISSIILYFISLLDWAAILILYIPSIMQQSQSFLKGH